MDLRVGHNPPTLQPPVQGTALPGTLAPAQPAQTPAAPAPPSRPLMRFSTNGRRRAELAQSDQASRSAQESVNQLQTDVAALANDEGGAGLNGRVEEVVQAAVAELEGATRVENPIRARDDASEAIASLRQSLEGQTAAGRAIQGNVSRENAGRLLS